MSASLHPPRFSSKTFGTIQTGFASKTANLTPSVKERVRLSTRPCVEVQASETPVLEEIRVDMAEVKVESRPVLLVTNVGSCVAICIHDSRNKRGGLLHIMLPNSKKVSNESLPYKYADTAVPALAEFLRKLGKGDVCLLAKIAGGANMFAHLKSRLLNIGAKNVEAVKEALEANGIRLLAEDVGGAYGRRVFFNVVTGSVYIQRVGGQVKKI